MRCSSSGFGCDGSVRVVTTPEGAAFGLCWQHSAQQQGQQCNVGYDLRVNHNLNVQLSSKMS
jgi:hypothetical protein